MSWIQKLYDTYPSIAAKDELNELWPTAHLKKNAHIEITIDGDGNFKRVNQLAGEDAYTLIPVTEKSGARTGNIEPHPLSEELSYCAFDLPDVKKKEVRNKAYSDLLEKWCKSEHSHPKALAVYKFVSKAEVWHLIKDSFEFPLAFKSKSATTKIEPYKCFVRWRVEISGINDSTTWSDESLIKAWQQYEVQINPKLSFCYVTGDERTRVAKYHPRFVRNRGDGARLVTRNDWSGLTFLGKFTDTESAVLDNNDSSQVCEVSFEVTQKAHSALRWLINNQATINGDQAIVTWAISGKPVPKPMSDFYNLDDDDLSIVEGDLLVQLTSISEKKDLSSDLGQAVAIKINKKLKGYYQELEDTEQLSIMTIDSATSGSGRLAVTYYQEKLSKEYFSSLSDWYEKFSWYQPTKDAGDKKTVYKIFPPTPKAIVRAAYGKDVSDTLKKSAYLRLLPCITDKRALPKDIWESAFQSACNPLKIRLDNKFSKPESERFAWEQDVGVFCGLYRGYTNRLNEGNNDRRIQMGLDLNNQSRDYLFGRLLAVAEKIEQTALDETDESKGRRTTAERLMQQFVQRPSNTWLNITKALDPYVARLHNSSKDWVRGFIVNRKNEITEITNMFSHDDFCDDKKQLSGEFLLGYHAQKMSYWKDKKTDDKSE